MSYDPQKDQHGSPIHACTRCGMTGDQRIVGKYWQEYACHELRECEDRQWRQRNEERRRETAA